VRFLWHDEPRLHGSELVVLPGGWSYGDYLRGGRGGRFPSVRTHSVAGGDSVKARVTVYPRREILDPQGKAIQSALARVGFRDVREVRAGKSFELDLGVDDAQQAGDLLAAMCEKLLANTVVEDYEIELLAADAS